MRDLYSSISHVRMNKKLFSNLFMKRGTVGVVSSLDACSFSSTANRLFLDDFVAIK